jgi:DNA-directed RNA polymerase subunit RPC12/RpoP
MSQDRLPPPSPPACLLRRCPSKQKGGTIVAEAVADLAAHLGICRPDGYRPIACPRCGCGRLHVHDYRHRLVRQEPSGTPTLVVVRYRCAGCGAVWLVLPLFMARSLRRSWPVVEAATLVSLRQACGRFAW